MVYWQKAHLSISVSWWDGFRHRFLAYCVLNLSLLLSFQTLEPSDGQESSGSGEEADEADIWRLSCGSDWHLPEPLRAYLELHSKSKPGGEKGVSDHPWTRTAESTSPPPLLSWTLDPEIWRFFKLNTCRKNLTIFPPQLLFQPSPSQPMTPAFTQFPKLDTQESWLIPHSLYILWGLSHQFLLFLELNVSWGPSVLSISTAMIIIDCRHYLLSE